MKQHLISSQASVLEALDRLNHLSGHAMTLLVSDDKDRITGTLTDGDIRRALLQGTQLNDAISGIINHNFHHISSSDDTVQRIRELRQLGLKIIPILDADGHLVKIIDLTATRTLLPISAIVMAGGKGERLRPMTLETPKPLLKVGNRAIIDHNIDLLARNGITDITVTTNYLAEKIENHFREPVCGVQVKCVRESRPLGTLGAASLISHNEQGNTMVLNSDLLTTISMEEMYLKHMDEQADITIAALPYNISVPYAILTTSGSRVTALEEKPSYAYYANAGIYLIRNRWLNLLPKNEHYDATDLIEHVISQGGKVTYYPINGSWIDIGTPADYKHACELVELAEK